MLGTCWSHVGAILSLVGPMLDQNGVIFSSFHIRASKNRLFSGQVGAMLGLMLLLVRTRTRIRVT